VPGGKQGHSEIIAENHFFVSFIYFPRKYISGFREERKYN
jgi:hypothetical protein